MSLKPAEVLSLTPRELTILMKAQTERQYDDYEHMAFEAIMRANASNATKRIKATDLFKRPSGKGRESKLSVKELREQIEKQQALLAQFTFVKKA